MARAKHTDRAVARRRYRATLVEPDTAGELAADEATASPPERAPAHAPAQSGMRYAFGAAFRPLDLRGDIAAIPQLLRSRALLIPVALQGLALASFLAVGTDSTSVLGFVSVFLFQYFIVAPPVAAAFLAGFLAPRASWLLGLATGIVAVIALGILMASPRIEDLGGTPEARSAALVYSLGFGPLGGALFASLAAWYKRFLDLANPNRRRAATSRGGSRSGTSGRSNARPVASRTSPRRR